MTEQRKRVQRTLRAGLTAEHGGKHIKVKDEAGKTIATLASTPGKGRALENEQALLKRLGALAESKVQGVQLAEEEAARVLEAAEPSAVEFARRALAVGEARGLQLPKTGTDGRAANSLAVAIGRLRRNQATAFRPWVAALLLAACEPVVEPAPPSQPAAPQPEPQPAEPEPQPEPEPGTNKQRIEAVESMAAAWEARLDDLELRYESIEGALAEIADHVTKPSDDLRKAVANVLRLVMET